MRFFILLIFTVCSALSFAQDTGSDAFFNLESLSSANAMFRSFDNRFKGVEGYPTLFEQYLPGKIYMRSGQVVTLAEVNFDLMTDELLVKHKGREMVVNKMLVKKFTMLQGSDSLRFVRIPIRPLGKFSEELIKGPFNLYKLTTKYLQEPQNKGEPYSVGKTNSEILPEVSYYWQKQDGELMEIKNKKTFLNELQQASKVDYSNLLKKNKIDIKEDASLILLFIQINSATNQLDNR
jgi:hypothetical protein